MKIRRVLTLGLAAGALVLAGCSTGEDDGGGGGERRRRRRAAAVAAVEAGDIRIDVVTHAAPGDSFWDVVKAGAEQAGEDSASTCSTTAAPTRASRAR